MSGVGSRGEAGHDPTRVNNYNNNNNTPGALSLCNGLTSVDTSTEVNLLDVSVWSRPKDVACNQHGSSADPVLKKRERSNARA